MKAMSKSHHPRSCPCKYVTSSLSSFTAAEFGDLHALAARKDIAKARDAAGYTPLHYSAQHGHVAATSLLLQLGCSVEASGGATPLHRASFAGAVATMRLLLGHGACDILAKDMSFGDAMTPLHKAVAGGRHLAVSLLLQELKARDRLAQALDARDRDQRTPLQLAKEYCEERNAEDEQASVARWDEVAGNRAADWTLCLELVQGAHDGLQQQQEDGEDAKQDIRITLPSPPMFLTQGGPCADCTTGADGCHLTQSWELAFQKALLQTTKTSKSKVPSKTETELNPSSAKRINDPSPKNEEVVQVPGESSTKSTPTATPDAGCGMMCSNCGQVKAALHRFSNNAMVCKRCKRQMQLPE